MPTEANTVLLRREVMVRLLKAFMADELEKKADDLPFDMRPKHAEVPYRCCIHKERAVLRERAIAAMGGSIEDDDDKTPLSEYARRALKREKPDATVMTVIDSACKGCGPTRIYVTDLCRGCVARPCTTACAFGAISVKDGRSYIDNDKCKKCTKCMQVCPYGAIAKTKVPCEDSCPVGAITKNTEKYAEIDASRCLSCGQCMAHCPFGAVAEKSQIIDILAKIKEGKDVVAMLAPAVAGQYAAGINKIAAALAKTGFFKVIEVAEGADITAKNEAEDFAERMERGDKFMTTSCCAAYREMVKKIAPELKPFVSETATPMHYTAELAKKRYPDCVTVFVGPCVAKRSEGLGDEFVDYVMNFEEMGAWLAAFDIDPAQCEDYAFDVPTSKQARNFPLTGGVAESVRVASAGKVEVRPTCVDGLNPKAVREMIMWAKKGECPLGNIAEVMACEGGCISGAACLNANKKAAAKIVSTYADKAPDLEPEK